MDADIRRADQQAIALPFGLENRTGGAGQVKGLVNAEGAAVFPGGEAPMVGAVGLQGQVGDGAHGSVHPGREQCEPYQGDE